MSHAEINYEQKFVAFVDILGFKGIVEKSADEDRPQDIARMIKRLGSDQDADFYRLDGAEICPCSLSIRKDMSFQITQISDCVIVSAEVSPAGAINIINYCRKVAERLLLREGVLCQGYLTMGKMYHDGYTLFGPAYQDALKGENNAACIKWEDESLGTPFIEIHRDVIKYIIHHEDECVREMYRRMTISRSGCTVISPYGVFLRMIDWATSGEKKGSEIRQELASAKKLANKIKKQLEAAKPINKRAKAKIDISLEEIAKGEREIGKAEGLLGSHR